MDKRYILASSQQEAVQQSVNKLGVVHLYYRGQKNLLKDEMLNINLIRKPGVPDNWEPLTHYVDGVINLNLIDEKFAPMDKYGVDKHIVGLIMAHQYSMKKGIKLFSEKAEKATLKEIK